MIIQVTRTEAIAILNQYFANLLSNSGSLITVLEIEILDKNNDFYQRLLNVLQPYLIGDQIDPAQKISAIGSLRTFHNQYGLREAKQFIVDNWNNSIRFVRENGRMPNRQELGL